MTDLPDDGAGAGARSGSSWPPPPGSARPAPTPPAAVPPPSAGEAPPVAASAPPSGVPTGWDIPGGASAGTRAAPKGRRGCVIGLVTAAAVVIGVVALAGALLLFSGGSFPNHDEKALIASLPGRVAATRCRHLDAKLERATTAVTCTGTGGVATIAAMSFKSTSDLSRAFSGRVSAVDASTEGSDCLDRDRVTHAYGSRRGYSGKLLCYTKRGHAAVVWTNAKARTLLTAERSDAKDVTLYDWWARAVDRDGPTRADVDALEAQVPSSYRSACRVVSTISAAGASVGCVTGDGYKVFYSQFDTVTSLSAGYEAIRADAGVAVDAGDVSVSTCPLEGASRVNGEITGRLLCSFADGLARLTYTDEATKVLVEVLPDDQTKAADLFARWKAGVWDPR